MVYIEYEELKIKYLNAQKGVDQIITEMERLFDKTQPKSADLEKDRVSGGSYENAFDIYLIEKERKNIDGRLAEAKAIMDERQKLLRLKEGELRDSKEIIDRLYVYRYLDRMKVKRIPGRVGYSRPQVYRMLSEIRRNMQHETK